MRRKIKYQGGITKALCQKQAERNKAIFSKNVQAIDISKNVKPNLVDFDVISFSGSAGFEDQVLSIYSFIVYAGTPLRWTIYSDGSYNDEQKQLFKKQFAFADIVEWDVYPHVQNNSLLGDYHLAKKLNVIIGHPYKQQTIYVDSDVVFYKNIAQYLNSGLLSNGLWYAPDTMWGNVDGYFKNKVSSIYPLNSGQMILNSSLKSDDIYEYLEGLNGNYHYFSEQSSFEYAFRKQNANLFDPRQFIIDTSDQFDFGMSYYPDNIAMRHYTTPVRHKIWQKGWKWHLGIK
jgi:hypothetical protein